jgi:hypothetical protein
MSGILPRSFKLPWPLYEPTSAWRQSAANAQLKEPQREYVHEMYHLLRTARVNFCWLNDDDFTVPIFEANPGSGIGSLTSLRTYFNESWPTSTLIDRQVQIGDKFAVKDIPAPADRIRPSGPIGKTADGHLVLVDRSTRVEYDFFAATTEIDENGESIGGGCVGTEIHFAGAIECFSLSGAGAQNPDPATPKNSARASGVPLLAGLLIPEDFEHGPEIGHAMAFAIPRLRHIRPITGESPKDYVYPATKTETSAYTASPYAMGAGERVRLRAEVFGADGRRIDLEELAPVTHRYLKALREYGAYLVDGSGGFTFYAEDIRTGNLNLEEADLRQLCGLGAGLPIPANSQWKALTRKLGEELQRIPFATQMNGKLTSNFDFVEDAVISSA